MKYNTLGGTDLRVSRLGFGCGSIGGLLVRGEYPKMREALARALELGVNYFDTAPLYGNGQSEVNLGAVLRELRAEALIGTKVRLAGKDVGRIGEAITESVEGSLRRLGRRDIDLIQVHNRIGFTWKPERDPDRIGLPDLGTATETFEALQRQGKVRFWGITAMGETDALRAAVAAGRFHSIQVPYNLLNPTAGTIVGRGFPFQDYGQIMEPASQKGMGVIAIRILAGGALSGAPERHPVASTWVNPIASEERYGDDVARARRFSFLVEEGVVNNLVEAAVRFAVSNANVSTALLGISSLEQLEEAVKYVERGPLPGEILARIQAQKLN
ncbi:MAG: aldo/keto reductase [Syntrophaceae bacterium]|nr:aldo/keto reductase [Syntrophaceae bacterium]